jgi:hypothetical protein
MRGYLLSILFFVFVNISFSQTVSEPLQPQKNTLVNSAGLPEEFLLFVPDTATQIFFNPARGASYKGNFIYVNYFSDYSQPGYAYLSPSVFETSFVVTPEAGSGLTLSKSAAQSAGTPFGFPAVIEETYSSSRNPSFSIGSLVDCGNVKWLFSLSNGISTIETGRNTIISNNYYTPPSSEDINENTKQNNTSDASATSLKVSRITSSGRNNYSVGAWGILYYNNSSSTYNLLYDRKRIYDNPDGSHYYNLSNIKKITGKDYNCFSAGLEFAFNNKSIDYVGRIGYQFSKSPQKIFLEELNIIIDTSYSTDPPQISLSSNYSTIDNYIKGDKNGVDLYSYFSHSSDLLTPGDKLFVSLYAFYTGGDKSYSIKVQQSRLIQGSSVFSLDTTISEKANFFNYYNSAIYFSAGYALNLTLSDIELLSGLKILGIYRDAKDLDGSLSTNSSTFFDYSYIKKLAGLTLPLYLNYSPEQWISVYGGMNFTYAYIYEKYDITDKQVSYSSSSINNYVSRRRINDNSSWQSGKSIYAGFELRHSSGLRILTFFNDNFTNIRNWNVSVGYHF